ncbi:MAG: SEC-C metal-binding domain-containing protein [Planctomycetaceae bacterium]
MKISPYALNRVAEEVAADDSPLAQLITANGQIRLEEVRAFSDEQLLDKLREVGTPIDRVEFERITEGEISAIAVADKLIERFQPDFSGNKSLNENWPWMACACLWERWMSRPSCEMLDDEVQAGYDESENGNSVVACIHWGNVWNHWLRIADERHCQTLQQLDELVSGTHYVSDWLDDFVVELYNAGEDTPVFQRRQLELCRTVLQRFPSDDQVLTEIFRGGLAEAHSLLGERDISDRLFEEWLANDPQWGWGWIGWSDCYCHDLADLSPLDADKAETLLKRGLEIEGLRDRNDVLERLGDLYTDLDRDEEADAVYSQMTEDEDDEDDGDEDDGDEDDEDDGDEDSFDPPLWIRDTRMLPDDDFEDFVDKPFLDDDRPRLTAHHKVGRNEPCPCGSGKKFKKCCGQQ